MECRSPASLQHSCFPLHLFLFGWIPPSNASWRFTPLTVGLELYCHNNSDKMHPCAFFSCLSPSKCNCNVGDQECTVKFPLEEVGHWLEGSEKPFIVWTNHKKLAHLTAADTWQTRWALFSIALIFILPIAHGPAILSV